MTIDPNTGLAQLPEGYHWRVASQHKLEIVKNGTPKEWSEWEETLPSRRSGVFSGATIYGPQTVEVEVRDVVVEKEVEVSAPFWIFPRTRREVQNVPIREARERRIVPAKVVYAEKFGTYRIKTEDYIDSIKAPDVHEPSTMYSYGRTHTNRTQQVVRTREVKVLDVPDPITKKNLLERTQLALANWQENKDLLGDYPPKKLES